MQWLLVLKSGLISHNDDDDEDSDSDDSDDGLGGHHQVRQEAANRDSGGGRLAEQPLHWEGGLHAERGQHAGVGE